jgi:hypothetical protein
MEGVNSMNQWLLESYSSESVNDTGPSKALWEKLLMPPSMSKEVLKTATGSSHFIISDLRPLCLMRIGATKIQSILARFGLLRDPRPLTYKVPSIEDVNRVKSSCDSYILQKGLCWRVVCSKGFMCQTCVVSWWFLNVCW